MKKLNPLHWGLAAVIICLCLCLSVSAQTTQPSTQPAAGDALAAIEQLLPRAKADRQLQADLLANAMRDKASLEQEVDRLRRMVAPPMSVGLNLEEVTDYSTSAMFANVALYFSGWGRPTDKPWEPQPGLTTDANGYPLADAGCFTYATGYKTGDYAFSMEGSGTPNFSVKGRFVAPPVRTGNVVTGTVRITAEAGGLLQFKVTQVDPANPPRNFRLIIPGLPADTARVSNPAFDEALKPFGRFRVGVGPQRVNSDRGRVREWADRVRPDQFPQTSDRGVALELLVAVANECGKDLWLSVPPSASDAYLAALGDFLAASLAPDRRVYVELGNELWNDRLGSWRPNWDAAQANPELTATDARLRSWQQVGWQSRRLALALRPKLPGRVRVILGGQASWAWNSADRVAPGPAEVALDYLAAKYPNERPADYLYGVAIALYRDADPNAGTVDGILASIDAALANQTLRDKDARHRAVATKYGVKLLAYESAVTVRGRAPATNPPTPDPRDLVQNDPRIGERVTALLAYAEQAGFEGVEYFYGPAGKLVGQTEGRYPLAPDLAAFATAPKARAALNFVQRAR